MSTLLSTKADDIARVLEDEIVGGAIAPGTVLRQEQLSERFEVSRTPVREALRRLAALGLVWFEPNRGVRVRSVSPAELREAYLVRAELEALATEVATPRMTAADLDALDDAERRFSELTLELRDQARRGEARESSLFVEWMQANYAFHDVIYAAAAMPLVERLAKSARRTFIGDRVWSARAELDELYAKNDLQHRAIREAIAAGQRVGSAAARPRARALVGPPDRDRDRVPRRRRAATPAGARSAGVGRRGLGLARATRRASSANVRMSGTVRSGVADASGVAPNPGLSWRRSTQTVVRPSCLPGTWSWKRLWAVWRMRSRGTSIVSKASSNGARLGLYARASSAVTIQSKVMPSRRLESAKRSRSQLVITPSRNRSPRRRSATAVS